MQTLLHSSCSVLRSHDAILTPGAAATPLAVRSPRVWISLTGAPAGRINLLRLGLSESPTGSRAEEEVVREP